MSWPGDIPVSRTFRYKKVSNELFAAAGKSHFPLIPVHGYWEIEAERNLTKALKLADEMWALQSFEDGRWTFVAFCEGE